jgi:peptide/nickel transport system substrate-binding protein
VSASGHAGGNDRTAGASRRRTALAVALLALLGPLLGCFAHDSGDPVVVAFQNPPSTLDPHLHNEIVAWSLLCNFYDALVVFDAEMKLRPALATSWEQLDPARTRFRLRRGVRFHDGSELVAADVVASFERARSHPGSRIRHHLAGIVAVRAEGDDVVVETAGPAPALLNRLAFVFVVPRALAGPGEITEPVGTGPYRFVARAPDGGVSAERFAGWQGRPHVRRVRFVFVEDDAGRTAAFLRGEIDVAAAFPEHDARAVGDRPGLRAVAHPQLQVRWLQVIPEAAPPRARAALSDPRVRRAMLLAIDRQHLADGVFRGFATVASQYLHPVAFGYDASLRPLPFDPAEARRLMAEAGFADGFEVELAHGMGAPGLVETLVADLARIGVRAVPRPMTFPEVMRRAQARELPLSSFGRSCTTADASEVFDAVFHTPDPARGLGEENYASFSDPEVDRLLEAAAGELDPARRVRFLQEAQRRALEALPVLPLVERWGLIGVSARIELTPGYDGWLRVSGFTPRP